MTRLREEDVLYIAESLKEYDKQLVKNVGKSLAGIAAHAIGRTEKEIYDLHHATSVAIIPVTCGEGIINGFSGSVQKIIEHLGFTAFVTGHKDVGGLAEAVKKGAKVIFLADDDHFVAINISTGRVVVDNGEATGKGYAAALDLMSGGLREREVLLLGAGPVGTGAAAFMSGHGARVFVYDVELEKAENLKKTVPGVQIVRDFYEALPEYKLLFDATPAPEIIVKEYVREDTMISAPGIPLGLSQGCLPLMADRLIHDALEIGVAAMLFEALSN
ncbi:FAD-dependent oxidoreductase [Peptococcaceae bacterium SCADC1_2_3]|nr:FAD-dependent oxidoreductase [Peptococcaceae bacterium SCADC1_2_3]KFI35615.1 FAD-dependent oxidoreductase [Peptococcaceae bacterium SCADC1_2_3]